MVNGRRSRCLLDIVWGEKYAMVAGVDGYFGEDLGGIGGMLVMVVVASLK